jgi:hypothetical protein
MLGVLLCYNDGDILEDAIRHLLENNHHVVAWNHGSTDETAQVLDRMRPDLLEVTDIGRDVDFYDLYPLMSKHLMTNYVSRYDWISWPDQDELLEGPTRTVPYCRYLEEVAESPHSWIEFNDLVYWHTEADDPTIASPSQRVRHYSMAKHGPPKIRSWRASATNIRWFNHNRAEGSRYPMLFHLRHYPMRSEAQMIRRITVDRAGIQHGPVNFHYENMKTTLASMRVQAADLHLDDGRSELSTVMGFDWSQIYGKGPKLPPEVVVSYVLSTKRWEIASLAKRLFAEMPAATLDRLGRERIDVWLSDLDTKTGDLVTVALEGTQNVRIISSEAARRWAAGEGDDLTAPSASAPVRSVDTVLGNTPITIVADAAARSVRVTARDSSTDLANVRLPLVALIPSHGGDVPRIADLAGGDAEFQGLRTMYYMLLCDSRVDADLAPVAQGAERVEV